MNFWQLNKKRLGGIAMLLVVFGLYLFYKNSPKNEWYVFPSLYGFIVLMYFGVFCLPPIQSFNVIGKLTDSENEDSVLSVVDPNYVVVLENEKSWFAFTTPFINGVIEGLPVKISYQGPTRSSSARLLTFSFGPLSLPNSKRIYGQAISFPMNFRKELKKDIKPDLISFVADIKAKGYTSGAGRNISIKHFDAYEE